MCAKILAYMTYVANTKKYIRRHTFYLVISVRIFPKLVLTYIESKIANLAKANIPVSFEKNPAFNLTKCFFKIYSLNRVQSLLLSHLSYAFSKSFIEIY